MVGNKSLRTAKKERQDEFYTQLEDIENELRHYKKHFKGKTVFCNCDDPYESNFFKYFAMKFNSLGLKKLIATCYAGSPMAEKELPLFRCETEIQETGRKSIPHKIVITEVTDTNGDGAINLGDVEYLLKNDKNVLTKLEGTGDFNSTECKELLKEADIVVTNPPFSLFRKYVGLLMEYGKQFLIMGNQNNISYRDVFSYIKEGKMWLGGSLSFAKFRVPDYYEERSNRFWIDEKGQRWRSFGNICWFTNLDYKERHDELFLYKRYTEEEYPKYDNYDAINVDKVSEIPMDYDGVMGVPITFLSKHCPEQFEIIGIDRYVEDNPKYGHRFKTAGKEKYARVLIRKK
ncbi:MAG: adenine-specific methyltransferase EcoRI family protein [Bacteroidales bacterium]|nr:adenine-specific methyltransferase EcoRI family protein [Bacteroidales bacterium]